MKTRKHILPLAAAVGVLATSAQAATTIVGVADFTLSSSSAAGPTHDNLPASFDSQIVPGTITPTASVGHVGSFVIGRLTDGNRGHTSGSNAWASAGASSMNVTVTFASADVAGLAFNWAWGDRGDGNYEVVINGTTSLGTFNMVDGVANGVESDEPNTYVAFDSLQTGVTSIEINMSSGNGQWGLDELEVYAGVVPEPTTTALFGLGGLALILRRRKG